MTLSEFSSVPFSRFVTVTRGVSFFLREYDKDYRFQGERHLFWEFVILLSGRALITAGDRVLHMSAGDAILHPPGEFHAISGDGGKSFKFGVFSFHGNATPPPNRCFHLPEVLTSRFLELLEQSRLIFRFWDDAFFWERLPEKENEAARFTNHIEHYLACCLDYPAQRHTPPTQSEEHYRRLMDVIREGLTRRMSVPQLAAAAGMSVSNAKRIFARYAKTGLADYYHRAVAEHARELLANGATVAETADALGFSDVNYFSVFYKRITGEPPRNHKLREEKG